MHNTTQSQVSNTYDQPTIDAVAYRIRHNLGRPTHYLQRRLWDELLSTQSHVATKRDDANDLRHAQTITVALKGVTKPLTIRTA